MRPESLKAWYYRVGIWRATNIRNSPPSKNLQPTTPINQDRRWDGVMLLWCLIDRPYGAKDYRTTVYTDSELSHPMLSTGYRRTGYANKKMM